MDKGQLLFHQIGKRHERTPVIIIMNLTLGERPNVFGDSTIDRDPRSHIHQCAIVETDNNIRAE